MLIIHFIVGLFYCEYCIIILPLIISLTSHDEVSVVDDWAGVGADVKALMRQLAEGQEEPAASGGLMV